MLIGIAAAVFMLVVSLVTGEVRPLPILLGVLLTAAYVFMRNIRVSGRRQYDADAPRP